MVATLTTRRIGALARRLWTRGDPASEEGRAHERERRALLTSITNLGVRAVTVLSGFVAVPLAMGHLGKERYGLWMTMSSAVSVLTVADLGVADGVMNSLSEALAKGDRDLARRIVSTGFFVLLAFCAAACAAFALTLPVLDWPAVLNAVSPLAVSETTPAVAVLVVAMSVNLVAALAVRVNLSFQEGAQNNLWQGAGSVIALGALYAAVHGGGGLPLLVAVLAGFPVLVTVLQGLWVLGVDKRWLLPRPSAFDRDVARRVFGLGVWFFLTYVAYIVVMNSGNVIVAHVVGVDRVADLSVPNRLFVPITMIVASMVNPLWPAYAEALARGDHAWVERSLRRSLWLTLLIAGAGAAGVLLAGPLVLRLWVGAMVPTSFALLSGIAVWNFAFQLGNTTTIFLMGVNAVRLDAYIRMGQAVVAVALQYALGREYGVAGVAWGLAVSEVLFRLVPQGIALVHFQRRLRNDAPPAPAGPGAADTLG